MPIILNTKSIYYNDCNLIAQPSHPSLVSRRDIPMELNRIFVSPMDAVVGPTFAKEASKIGLSVCIHRFTTIQNQLEIYKQTNSSNVFASIGLNDWDRVDILKDYTSNWLIDCANGYLASIKTVIERLEQTAHVKNLIVGNIHSSSGIEIYKTFSGAQFNLMFRVGIAGGSACSTSDATGVNRGQITEIIECSSETEKYPNFYTIADGGIKNGNYAAKAFGAGADFIMLGGFFARAKEAETNIIGDGTFWGGASLKQQERYGGKRRHSEGKVYKIEESLESLYDLIHGDNGIWGGLSSTVSYSGYNTLTDFIGNGVFEIKENSLPPGNRK